MAFCDRAVFNTHHTEPDLDRRVHGEVSREPAHWRRVPAVHQQDLQDVIYEKSVGEGIAKVLTCLFFSWGNFPYVRTLKVICEETFAKGVAKVLQSPGPKMFTCVCRINMTLCYAAVQITINRPERRNAFRPQTTAEMIRCFDDARNDPDVGVVVLTGLPL